LHYNRNKHGDECKTYYGLVAMVPEVVGDPEFNVEGNSHGHLQFYPYGSTRVINGKTLETYVTCSDNGSITGNILTDVLKHLDTHLQFDHEEATPFFLLDGHRSRFELSLLDSVTDERTKGTVSIRVPYGTNLWQVGDSSQQKGAFKVRLTYEKKVLIEEKSKLYTECSIGKHDIVGLVNLCWNKSFERVDSNKHTMSEQGWNPLTYNLLDHPELKRYKSMKGDKAANNAYQLSAISGRESQDAMDLNLSSGMAKMKVDTLILLIIHLIFHCNACVT
jgi:hypothetical protein